ncbi:MAG: hypothetical protein PHP85_14145 [Gallionella sp.]|nr:hypothetical protein [Gallionella sp.]
MLKISPPNALPGLIRKAVRLLVAATLIGLTLMFSVVIFSVVAILGATALCYLWWKTRKLRKALRDQTPGGRATEEQVSRGQIIEGEAVRVKDAD